jgi:LysR family transcriptional regulator, low CO2-responsive transcriptional regulator
MDSRLLRMFICVAENGSVVGAARELHLTPSAISHGLKALESELGVRLFERAGKKVLLNHVGEQLLAQVKPLLNGLAVAEESVRRLGKWGQTRLRIGVAASACQYILPGVIRELKKNQPGLVFRIELGDMSEMVELIRVNQIDLALGVTPESKGDLVLRPVFRDELLFVFAPSHPWATAQSISREDLRKQPLILYQRKSLTARIVDDYFRSLDLAPSTVMEIGSIEAIKELVKLNLGVSVLAPWVADKEIARGKLRMRPIGKKKLAREWVVVHARGRRLNLTEETFCRLCRTHATGMRLDRRDLPALEVKG